MKASDRFVFAMVIGTLILQGCVDTSVRTGAEPATMPEPSISAASAAAVPRSAAIPDNNGKPVVKADTKDNFDSIVAAIHQQMQPGGRWQYIDGSERSTMDDNFADMGKLYEQFGSVDKMDNAAKVRLLADQSTVNAILTKKDGERLICTSEMPVGSHLAIKKCRTYAEVQAEQNGAQEFLRTRAAQTQQISGH